MKLPSWMNFNDSEDKDSADNGGLVAVADSEAVLKEIRSILGEPQEEAGEQDTCAETPVSDEQCQRDRSLYQAILSSLYDAVIIVDQKGYIIASNRRAEQFFGHTEADFWDLPCVDIITGFNPLVLAKIRKHVSNGRFTVLNANCRRKDASTFPAEIAISNIHYLNSDDLLLSVRSLERRKKAEERRELELDAVRYCGVGLMVCRRDGLIEYVNPPAVRMLRCPDENKVQQRFIGDFCESLKSSGQILQMPISGSSWTGRVNFRSADNHSQTFTVTSALSVVRKDGVERVVVSLMPVAQASVATGVQSRSPNI